MGLRVSLAALALVTVLALFFTRLIGSGKPRRVRERTA